MKKNEVFLSALKRENNLNVIKFICAIMVIFHHSFPITIGNEYTDPFLKATNNQFSFGNLAVIIFLFLAGMLITSSFINTNNGKKFIIKRIKRILPSLVIVILLTVFIIGPIFTNLKILDYFRNTSTWKYLICNCLLITNHNLSVFMNNPYTLSPNGALWTLPVEFLGYIGILILGSLKLLKQKLTWIYIILIVLVTSAQSLIINTVSSMWPVVQIALFFGVGMLFYLNFDKIKFNFKYFIIAVIITILSLIFNFYSYVNVITIPYMVVYLIFYVKPISKPLNYLGKYSYEIYLLGFLIQQCIAAIWKLSFIGNFLIAVPIVIILAIIINKISNKVIKLI